jgi:hypothetical protein
LLFWGFGFVDCIPKEKKEKKRKKEKKEKKKKKKKSSGLVPESTKENVH